VLRCDFLTTLALQLTNVPRTGSFFILIGHFVFKKIKENARKAKSGVIEQKKLTISKNNCQIFWLVFVTC
jgi:hypothetical protein